jgi:hypothetical protein
VFRLDGHRPTWWRGAPALFGDTRAVLRAIAGYDNARIERLAVEGAIATAEEPDLVAAT